MPQITVCLYTTQFPCSHNEQNLYSHCPYNLWLCITSLLASVIKEVTHIYIAGIDITTLAVLMTLQRPQHHTIVIICAGEAHHATHTTGTTHYTAHLHTQMLAKRFFSLFSALLDMVMDLSSPSWRDCGKHSHHLISRTGLMNV